MKKLATLAIVAASLLLASPALADRDDTFRPLAELAQWWAKINGGTTGTGDALPAEPRGGTTGTGG